MARDLCLRRFLLVYIGCVTRNLQKYSIVTLVLLPAFYLWSIGEYIAAQRVFTVFHSLSKRSNQSYSKLTKANESDAAAEEDLTKYAKIQVNCNSLIIQMFILWLYHPLPEVRHLSLRSRIRQGKMARGHSTKDRRYGLERAHLTTASIKDTPLYRYRTQDGGRSQQVYLSLFKVFPTLTYGNSLAI